MSSRKLMLLVFFALLQFSCGFNLGDFFSRLKFWEKSKPQRRILDYYDKDVVAKLNPEQIESILELEKSDANFRDIDPESFMTVEEIIRYHGYPVERYVVKTTDGFIITIQRIPFGKNGSGKTTKIPVLLQHGLLSSSAVWVSNTPDKNLPYILADLGYDVWLGNIRGTRYGEKNIYYTKKQKEFWAYSFDEMAEHDVPQVIDKILEVTNKSNIYYIGHSMGTTICFALLSTQPKYNDIIKGMFALAPVASVTHMKSPVRYLATFKRQFSWLMNIFGHGEFIGTEAVTKFFARTLCRSPLKIFCQSTIFVMCGYDESQINSTRLPVYLHLTPAATSVQNMVHYAQMYQTGKFQYHDYGTKLNLQKYGSPRPPIYNLTQITTPISIFWSDNDILADPKDVSWVASRLESLILNYQVPNDKFDHMDFLWAMDVKSLVYDKLIGIMDELY